MIQLKKIFMILVSLILVAAFILTGCGGKTEEKPSATVSALQPPKPVPEVTNGAQWTVSILSGNLPEEVPDVSDDLYTHYNYDCLKEHQGEEFVYLTSGMNELPNFIVDAVKNSSSESHELEQLRLFYGQAADLETLAEIGFSEVQPYIDMIDQVSSIGEMNVLLTSEEFPFSPFLKATLGTINTQKPTQVAIYPDFVLADATNDGARLFQDVKDPDLQEEYDSYLSAKGRYNLADLSLLGIEESEQTGVLEKLIDFEKAYGKHADFLAKYLNADYGFATEEAAKSIFSMDELCAVCPNLPIQGMLEHCQKDSAKEYNVSSSEWLRALSDLWTDENLEMIKLAAKCKVLVETRPYRDQSVFFEKLERDGILRPHDADSLAYYACNSVDTFSQVMAEMYADECLGQNCKERLNSLTEEYVDAYKELVENTGWLSSESKKMILEKLDQMTINILAPEGGYLDYSGLQLSSADQGGTLFSNYLELKQYRLDRESERIGTAGSTGASWFVFNPTNPSAYYEGTTNSINILPGFVNSAIYTESMSPDELIAAIGFIIGHEISHGFDYVGSQIDAYGKPVPVFMQDDSLQFLERCMKLADYYSRIEYMPGKFVEGRNVMGEAAADLCGMQASLLLAKKMEGIDYDHFFRCMSLCWAAVKTPEALEYSTTDVHPFEYLRVNVNAQMFDTIYEEFGVKEGDGMYLAPERRIAIWGES